jgi:hypothetical protein
MEKLSLKIKITFLRIQRQQRFLKLLKIQTCYGITYWKELLLHNLEFERQPHFKESQGGSATRTM